MDLDPPAARVRARPRPVGAHERELGLPRHRPRPREVLPALEREERLARRVVERSRDLRAREVAELVHAQLKAAHAVDVSVLAALLAPGSRPHTEPEHRREPSLGRDRRERLRTPEPRQRPRDLGEPRPLGLRRAGREERAREADEHRLLLETDRARPHTFADGAPQAGGALVTRRALHELAQRVQLRPQRRAGRRDRAHELPVADEHDLDRLGSRGGGGRGHREERGAERDHEYQPECHLACICFAPEGKTPAQATSMPR